jgi:hypothetical protein
VNALLVLSYGDRHTLVNALRELRRRPGRAAMWLLYLVAIAGFAVLKTAPRSARSIGPHSPWADVLNDMIVGGLTVAFGVVLATGPERWLGFFSSRTEALLMMRGTASPVVVAAYLQARAILSTLAGGLSRLAYFFILAVPAGTTVHALALQLAFFAAAAAAITSVALPRALARGAMRVAMIVLGSTIGLIAALPLVADALRLVGPAETPAVLRDLPHPGAVLTALSTGDLRAIAPPLLIAAIATAAFALSARDAYPELYALSLANLDFRERLRSRRSRPAEAAMPGSRAAAGIRSSRRSWWRGSLAFIWIDALMFSRRVSPVRTALVASLALAAGAALALFSRRSPELFFGILIGTLPGLCVAVTSTVGVRLAPALRLPLFWLGDAPLAARLAAWTFGGFWRDAVLIVLVVVAYLALLHDPRAGIAFVCALGFLALTRTVGLAVFALLPNALDQRGPAILLRTLLSFALLAPPVVAGVVAAIVLRTYTLSLIGGTVVGTGIALAEAAALIGFSAWRLAGRVDRLSAA